MDRARGPVKTSSTSIFFFDFRPVHGDGVLAGALWEEAWAAARAKSAFLKLLAEASAVQGSPFGVFGRLRRENGRIDLKRYGLLPVVATARLLALRHGISVRGTAERLHGVGALDLGGAADLKAALDIHERILDLILRAQLADIDSGHPPSNLVPMTIVEQRGGTGALKADLRVVRSLYDLVRDHLS